MWFACWVGGLCAYDGKTFVRFDDQDGLTSPYANDLHIGRDGDVWVTTLAGVFRYDPGSVAQFSTRAGLSSGAIVQIVETADLNLWCLSSQRALYRYDGAGFGR
jgi:sugar lactone lactonase YvrE